MDVKHQYEITTTTESVDVDYTTIGAQRTSMWMDDQIRSMVEI